MIYFLLITDIELSYDDFIHDFMIGAFDTEEKAMETVEHYIKNIEGFNKYKCTYRVEGKQFSDDMLINPLSIYGLYKDGMRTAI